MPSHCRQKQWLFRCNWWTAFHCNALWRWSFRSSSHLHGFYSLSYYLLFLVFVRQLPCPCSISHLLSSIPHYVQLTRSMAVVGATHNILQHANRHMLYPLALHAHSLSAFQYTASPLRCSYRRACVPLGCVTALASHSIAYTLGILNASALLCIHIPFSHISGCPSQRCSQPPLSSFRRCLLTARFAALLQLPLLLATARLLLAAGAFTLRFYNNRQCRIPRLVSL